MKKMALLFMIATQNIYSVEVGRHDGGEYYYRQDGQITGRMYPRLLEEQNFKDASVYAYDEQEEVASTNSAVVMNFEKIRSYFPILATTVHGQPLIYFDSAATAQMPCEVIDAIVQYYQTYKSNVGRGLYDFAEKATQKFEEVRGKVARFIGAKRQEIVFTAGATNSINLVAQVWAQHHIKSGDEIVISEVEHNANFIPWQQLAQRTGIVLKRAVLNDRGVIDIAMLKSLLSPKTKLVAITAQSNILGTLNDVASITQAAHEVGAKVLIDAAQLVAHHAIDVKKLDCDFLVFSGHKLFGPTGVGVLFIKQDLFDQCVLQNFGGGMVYSVTLDAIKCKAMPHCMEPGTQPIAQVIGLGAAIDFVTKHINFEQAAQHTTMLARKLALALVALPGVTLLTPIAMPGETIGMVTFVVDGYHAYDIAEHLNEYGIAVRAGYHCVQPYHDAKVAGNASVRVSLSVYNTEQEIDVLIECLKNYLC